MGIKLFSLIDKLVNNQVVRATVFNISVANKQVVKHIWYRFMTIVLPCYVTVYREKSSTGQLWTTAEIIPV